MRMLTPASASIASQTAQKMIVLPKSGCFISRKAMPPVSTAESGKTGSDLSCSRRHSSQAMAMTKKGLRNSDGCTWPMPKSIQRLAPFTSGPRIGHEDQQHEEEGGAEQRQPPRPFARHHRDADHHRNADRDPRELALEIIKLGEADVAARIALRRRRARPRRRRSGRCRSAR